MPYQQIFVNLQIIIHCTTSIMIYPILDTINSPSDLKRIDEEKMPALCDEIRHFLIEQLAVNPGHLGANLGVVELTVALHRVFNTPYDRIVWDVGHQAYTHKILTGRRQLFSTNRCFKGLSGFPTPKESEYDSFGTGHSSTSISAALGMAIAANLKGERDRQVVAVIGDGALTGGLAFEGLNNASINPNNLLIVLNDNSMAIDPIHGGLNHWLTRLHLSPTYNRLRYKAYRILRHIGLINENDRRRLIRLGNSIKSLRTNGKGNNIFEGLNIRYFGPIDGHDVHKLTETLNELKTYTGPKVLHIITKKGKGYLPAESEVTTWHAPGNFNPDTGERIKSIGENEPPKFQDVFGQTLLELAKADERIVGVTPAMLSGCSMNVMMNALPKRTFDVGIAEGHAVTFSAGLSKEGFIPFCNIYSSFMQRAIDNVIHDVALQNLHVIFCLDRAGLVGNDGATHQGQFDLALFRPIPNMKIAVPRNEHDLRHLMHTALSVNGPIMIRYPRGKGVLADWRCPMKTLEIGVGEEMISGSTTAIVGIGPILYTAQKAIELHRTTHPDDNIGLYDLRWLKPLDQQLMQTIATRYSKIITVEDGTTIGGAGAAVEEWMNAHHYHPEIVKIGLPDAFVEHGSPAELYHMLGLDAEGICKTLDN